MRPPLTEIPSHVVAPLPVDLYRRSAPVDLVRAWTMRAIQLGKAACETSFALDAVRPLPGLRALRYQDGMLHIVHGHGDEPDQVELVPMANVLQMRVKT